MRAIAAAFVVSAVIAVPAQASTTVGGVTPQGATSFNCGTASTHAQTSTGLAPPSYSIPFDGVLTSWRTAAESASTQLAQVRVLRPLTGDTFTVVGSTAIESLKPSVLNDNRPARIPVHAGDVLAMSTDPEGAPMSPSGVFCTFATGDTADAVRSGGPGDGATLDLQPTASTKTRLNLAVTIERDADSDGYGDETQDACPSDATAHVAPCAAGATRVGQTFEPTGPCDQATYVPADLSWGNSYAIASGGVLTSWEAQAPAGPATDPMKFKVFRPAGAPHQYAVIAESSLVNVAGSGVQSFPFRLTVQPGDRIGLYSDANVGFCGRHSWNDADTFEFVNSTDVLAGATGAFSPGAEFRFDVAATVEPDRDGDGFGDITQDACPTDPNRQSCPNAAAFAAISKVSQSAKRWRLGRKLLRISRKPKVPVGTTFTFTLDKAASVRLEFSRIRPGRKVGGHCERATKRNRKKRRCSLITLTSHPAIKGHAGVNRVRFQGRVSRRKTLVPGRYRLRMSAFVVPGLFTHSKALRFTIVK